MVTDKSLDIETSPVIWRGSLLPVVIEGVVNAPMFVSPPVMVPLTVRESRVVASETPNVPVIVVAFSDAVVLLPVCWILPVIARLSSIVTGAPLVDDLDEIVSVIVESAIMFFPATNSTFDSTAILLFGVCGVIVSVLTAPPTSILPDMKTLSSMFNEPSKTVFPYTCRSFSFPAPVEPMFVFWRFVTPEVISNPFLPVILSNDVSVLGFNDVPMAKSSLIVTGELTPPSEDSILSTFKVFDCERVTLLLIVTGLSLV